MNIGRALRNFCAAGLVCSVMWGQAAAPAPSPPGPPADPLGRETPRGTVLRFLSAASKGDYETARRYLNTTYRGERADTLARQLSVVLDRRLPAQLNKLSSLSEGSQYYPDRPDADLVGTIAAAEGTVDIIVQRVDRGKNGAIWQFSKETLAAIPALYSEVDRVSAETILPALLTERKIAGIPLFQWLFALVGMPLIYVLMGLLDRGISPLASRAWRRISHRSRLKTFRFASPPVRLLVLVLVIRWMVANLNLSLLTRQFWVGAAVVMLIAASVWLLLMLNGWIEDQARGRLGRRGVYGAVSILRLIRRSFDLLALFAGALVLLAYFKLNVSAALAGLGVGGIAIALAAQKTLENVIGGISIIADRAVRVGDFLKIGDTVGTVEDIGLRSTRIRTQERSMVVIPNGQISNERLENLSSRDMFWFHPTLNLRYETTAAQMRVVLETVRQLLVEHTRVQQDSVRVRFLRFGSSSLDLDVFAYVLAPDFSGFLETQEGLLLQIMDAIQSAGTRMAFPSQTTYLASDSTAEEPALSYRTKLPARH
jgi:MscS family membrane protein